MLRTAPDGSLLGSVAVATVVLVVVTVGVGIGVTAGVGATQDAPVVTVEDASVQPGETVTVNLSLTRAPQGLAGYNLTVTVTDPATATVTGVSAPSQFQISPTAVLRDGTVANVEAVDLSGNVEPGASDVPLGTVTLRGETDGETTLRVAVLAMDSDDGDPVSPALRNGTVTVGSGTETQPPTATETATATRTASPTTSSESGPGFGVLPVGLAVLVAATVVARIRG
jgi:hypothetical protein